MQLQCRRPGFHHWLGKIPCTRAWQHIPVFLLGESPWTEDPGRLQSMGSERVRHDWATKHNSQRDRQAQGIIQSLSLSLSQLMPASLWPQRGSKAIGHGKVAGQDTLDPARVSQATAATLTSKNDWVLCNGHGWQGLGSGSQVGIGGTSLTLHTVHRLQGSAGAARPTVFKEVNYTFREIRTSTICVPSIIWVPKRWFLQAPHEICSRQSQSWHRHHMWLTSEKYDLNGAEENFPSVQAVCLTRPLQCLQTSPSESYLRVLTEFFTLWGIRNFFPQAKALGDCHILPLSSTNI